MSDIPETVRPDVVPGIVQHVDGLLGPLVAYLDALEARVTALERRSCAVPLMTAADAARHAQVNVETILRAVRAGELPVAGYIGRSPRRPQPLACREIIRGGAPGLPAAPPATRAQGKRCRRGGMASAGLNAAPARSPRPTSPPRDDGPDDAPKTPMGGRDLESAAARLPSVRA
jgi:hypothetical protein